MNDKQKLKAGIFIVIGVVIFIFGFTAIMSDESMLSRKNTYHTYLKDTQGIMFGSVVSFSGINVGNVHDIEYIPEKETIKMTLKISKKYENLITDTSLVQLKTQGALGDRFVYIKAGGSGKVIPNHGEIPMDQRPDLLDQIGSKLSDLEQFSLTLKKIDAIITNFGEGVNFEEMGKNFNSAIKSFAGASETIKNQAQIKPTLDRLNASLDAINSKKGTLGQLIYDPTLHKKIMSFLGEDPDDDYLKSLMRKSIEATETSRTK